MNGTIIILADGEFPHTERCLQMLRTAETIICCDGAAQKLIANAIKPTLITGDMDSLPEKFQKRYEQIIVRKVDQQTNDLTKAFELALTLNPSSIHILGATGGREDHTMGNISLLADYAARLATELPGCGIDIISDYGRFEAVTDSRMFHCEEGQEISIFAFDRTLRIVASGLMYPTDAVVFDTLWKATLNKAVGDCFQLTFSHPSPAIVYFAL